MIRLRVILPLFWLSASLAAAAAADNSPKPTPELKNEWPVFDEGSVLDQVIMSSDAPKVYDWRNADYELELGLDDVDEQNVFPSRGFHLGAGFSLGGGWQFRTGLRRIEVRSSGAGRMIEKTPFRQPGQPTRWEMYGAIGLSLLEGRTSSRFSPLFTDFESVLSAELGAHYAHPSSHYLPTKKGERDREDGQSVGVSCWVIDLGLRYEVFLPRGFGLFMTSAMQFPVSHIDGPLAQWTAFSVGTVVAIGDNRKP